MEQKETYTPYQERSLDELRRDINLKAKKLFLTTTKGEKILLAIVAIALVVFYLLNWHYKWVATNWWMLGTLLCISALVVFLFYTIDKKLFSAMEGAVDAKQHLKATKKLIRSQQWKRILSFCLGFLVYLVTVHGKIDNFDVIVMTFFFIFYVFWMLVKPRAFIDRDFWEDVEELSMNVE
jgi:hypothetical protein